MQRTVQVRHKRKASRELSRALPCCPCAVVVFLLLCARSWYLFQVLETCQSQGTARGVPADRAAVGEEARGQQRHVLLHRSSLQRRTNALAALWKVRWSGRRAVPAMVDRKMAEREVLSRRLRGLKLVLLRVKSVNVATDRTELEALLVRKLQDTEAAMTLWQGAQIISPRVSDAVGSDGAVLLPVGASGRSIRREEQSRTGQRRARREERTCLRFSRATSRTHARSRSAGSDRTMRPFRSVSSMTFDRIGLRKSSRTIELCRKRAGIRS